MYQCADPFALMTTLCYAVVNHVVFARSHDPITPDVTTTISTCLTSAPNMNLQYLAILNNLSCCIEFVYRALVMTFRGANMYMPHESIRSSQGTTS